MERVTWKFTFSSVQSLSRVRLCDSMNCSTPVEIYITIYKIESQKEFAVCLRNIEQGLCINLEGWDGEGYGREVQEGGDICIPMADSC